MGPDAFITFVQVSDLAASHEFYADALGLVMVEDQGACRIYQVADSAFLGICNHAGPPSPDGIMLTIVRDDVEEWSAALAAQGLEFLKPPQHNARFGITQAMVCDPDGHIIEIQRFDDPAWADPAD